MLKIISLQEFSLIPISGNLQPLYVRITVNGKRSEFTTKRYVNAKLWDQKAMKLKGNSEESRSINSYLDSVKSKVIQTQTLLEYSNAEITLALFMDNFAGRTTMRERTIISIFQDHNNRIKALLNIEYAYGTYQRYETSLCHTRDFIKHQYGLDDISIHKINHAFITDYDFYLRTVRLCANNTVVKYIKNFKKIVRICISNGWLEKDPFLNYKVKLHEVERDILTQDELTKMAEKEITLERLAVVRDMFLFSCFTGLAFIDVKKLTKANIVRGIDGQVWISTNRQKTDTASKIPLLEIPRSIITKYEDHPKCNFAGTLLPVSSNQTMNAYLKELADLCGINKALTFHCARHTFATTVTLSNGVPIESVSKMLGHKSIKTTQHYAKITDSKVANDMQNLRATLKKQNGENSGKAKSG